MVKLLLSNILTRGDKTELPFYEPLVPFRRCRCNFRVRSHVLVENRNGLIVGAMATAADGYAERDAAMLLVHERWRRGERIETVATDKGYDSRDFVDTIRAMNVRAHVTQNNIHRRSAIDGRTTRHWSYAISQQKRPLIERTFGWMKAIAGMRKVKLRGLLNVDWLFVLTAAAFNLWRIPKLKLAAA